MLPYCIFALHAIIFQFCAVLKSGPAPKVLGPKRQGQQQSTLWHFVQNSKVAVHDQTWLLHCRKHYASAVLAGDTVKVRYFGFRIRLISLHVFLTTVANRNSKMATEQLCDYA